MVKLKEVDLGEVHSVEELVDAIMRETLKASIDFPFAKERFPEICSELERVLEERYGKPPVQ